MALTKKRPADYRVGCGRCSWRSVFDSNTHVTFEDVFLSFRRQVWQDLDRFVVSKW